MGTSHLLLAFLVISNVAAQRGADETENGDRRIINGQDADPGEYPFMVRITSAVGDHGCGGSLISPRIVLTAAHCVTFESGAKAPVELGRAVVGDYTSSNTEENEQVLEGIRIIVNEDYYVDPTGVPYNDVALIVLKKEVDLKDGAVSTIALPEDDSLYKEGTPVTVIGWGIDNEHYDLKNMVTADVLQELEYEIANEDECKQYWLEQYKTIENDLGLVDYEPKVDDIAEFMICAIDPAREATVFYGDSGGPLFVKNKETFTQIGLVSWGDPNPEKRSNSMYANVFRYKDWIETAMKRAEEESWLELDTGGSGGIVMVLNQNGQVNTICNDEIGKDEVNAICRDQGYKGGVLADPRDYQTGGRRQKDKNLQLPKYGYTNLNCKSDAKIVMTDCDMDKYEDSKVPCFDGQQLAVNCADEAWSFKVTNMMSQFKPIRGSLYVKGKVMCMVQAQKNGINLDMKSQVRVGLVIRRQDRLDEITSNMKYKRRKNVYVTKIRPGDEIKANACFACIAYIPGTKFYAVGKLGPNDCPDDKTQYEKWVEEQDPDRSKGEVLSYNITTKQIKDGTIVKGQNFTLNTIGGNTTAPVIHVRTGELVQLKVTNGIKKEESDFGLSIHWHGLNMNGAQIFDGVVGLTQCPIVSGTSYNYDWKINEEPGTYWYHTHDKKMYPDGQYDFIKGPMIIHDKDAKLPSNHSYQYYGNETILFYTMYNFSYNGNKNKEWAGYINGERYSENDETIPTFKIKNGEHRFRIINGVGSVKSSFFFGIDGHKLRVIATDAYPVEPYETDMIEVAIAERYDVLVKFNITNTTENFWIRALTTTSEEQQKNRVLGILRVSTNSAYNPDPPPNKNKLVDFDKIDVLNCLKTKCKNGSLVTKLTTSPRKVKKRKLLDSFYYHTYDIKYNITKEEWQVSIDSGPFQANHIPCRSAIMESSRYRWSNNTNVLTLPLPKSITIVIRNLTPERHPMHMHGHHFEVLEINTGQNNINTNNDTCKGLLSLDKAFSEPIDELMKRKKEGVLKDTIILPPCGAVALRINSDNRGIWFFHCHIDYHLHHGLALVLDEGGYLFSESKFPSDYPSCDDCHGKN